jgi:hypothetical protein
MEIINNRRLVYLGEVEYYSLQLSLNEAKLDGLISNETYVAIMEQSQEISSNWSMGKAIVLDGCSYELSQFDPPPTEQDKFVDIETYSDDHKDLY